MKLDDFVDRADQLIEEATRLLSAKELPERQFARGAWRPKIINAGVLAGAASERVGHGWPPRRDAPTGAGGRVRYYSQPDRPAWTVDGLGSSACIRTPAVRFHGDALSRDPGFERSANLL